MTLLEQMLGDRIVRIVRDDPKAVMPSLKSALAAGADLHSIEMLEVAPRSSATIDTGLKVQLPTNLLAIDITPRSGIANKNKITVLNSPGLIDPDYRGRLMVILFNHSDDPFTVNVGDRIAQMKIIPNFMQLVSFQEVTELTATDRGEGGLGSTGVA